MGLRYSTCRPLLLAALLACSSCTCHQEAPPPPTAKQAAQVLPTRPPGFNLLSKATPTPAEAMPPSAAEGTPTPYKQMPQAEIPADFPSDVPILEGSELAAVQKLAGDAKNVLFTTKQNPKQIFAFYKGDLKAKGYELTQEYETAEQSFLSFKRGNFITNVIIAPDPNDKSRRVIAIMYQEEPEDIEEF